jgi:hypothetical protein
VDLQSRLIVGEVRQHKVLSVAEWTGYFNTMPLPDLNPSVTSGKRHQAAFFDELCLVGPDDLDLNKRVACMSQTGVNLLLQRWVHYSSRAVISTATYQEVSSPAYEETDLIEEWVEERVEVGLDLREATVEAMKWLREDTGGVMRQRLLEEPQSRSTIRRQLRVALRQLR